MDRSAILDFLSKNQGLDTVSGRIKTIQRLDTERVSIRLFEGPQVLLFLNKENEEKMRKRIFEIAVFVGKTTLGNLEATTVIFGKEETSMEC